MLLPALYSFVAFVCSRLILLYYLYQYSAAFLSFYKFFNRCRSADRCLETVGRSYPRCTGCKIGGASAAAYNDLPDRVIKKHGRWKSEKARDTYCREDIQHQLLVTLNVGI